MRNVVTLSDVPQDVHDWLKQEAARQSEKTGKRVGLYQVVLQAINKYRADLENNHSSEKEAARVTN